ncbi:DUF6221 family protein [Streptomyces nitrosporeus]|uniref:DUF6221 family protein n=1 Tax=Streptomyces nitrosporeus TaxID=28894 RepID=UPI0039A2E0A5
MSSMDDLVQFLRARLDEDEQAARAAAEPEQWVELNRTPQTSWSVEYWADPDRAAVVAEGSSAYPVVVTTQGMEEADAEARAAHIARHDPTRVLAEIDAKQRLIEWVLRWPMRPAPPSSVDGVLELLALPYAGHPDHRDAWRP